MLHITYSLACFFLPIIITQVINRKKYITKPGLKRHMIWAYIFLLYWYITEVHIVCIGTLWDIVYYNTVLINVNLIPFKYCTTIQMLLNVILFLPLGFLLPLIWKNYRNILKVTLFGFVCSLGIELLQLFTIRVTDINDLMANTLGALLGYLIWRLFKLVFKNAGEKATEISAGEAANFIILSTLGIFLFYCKHLFY